MVQTNNKYNLLRKKLEDVFIRQISESRYHDKIKFGDSENKIEKIIQDIIDRKEKLEESENTTSRKQKNNIDTAEKNALWTILGDPAKRAIICFLMSKKLCTVTEIQKHLSEQLLSAEMTQKPQQPLYDGNLLATKLRTLRDIGMIDFKKLSKDTRSRSYFIVDSKQNELRQTILSFFQFGAD